VTYIIHAFILVQILDNNPDVDVIMLLDYDRDVLRMPNILITKHKKLIKLGARSTNIVKVMFIK
jgi:hypothetical protein